MAPAFQPDLDISVAWIGFFRLQFPKDFKLELFRVQSPLLTESQLVSFPPLSYMLKFSGSSHSIGGSIRKLFPVCENEAASARALDAALVLL